MFQHPATLAKKGITSMIYLYVKQYSITGLKYFGKTKEILTCQHCKKVGGGTGNMKR